MECGLVSAETCLANKRGCDRRLRSTNGFAMPRASGPRQSPGLKAIRRPSAVLTSLKRGRLVTTILLSRSDIAALMRPADYIAAVEKGFRAAKQGRAMSPPPLHLECAEGGFHAKAASLTTARSYAAFKLNGNFPANPAKGTPTIQGALLLSDAADGTLLAVMDSSEVTVQRTAAATALAARYLA